MVRLCSGFTLIEVIVASLIIILFSTFFFYFINTSLFNVKSSNEYIHGVCIVSNTMENIKKKPFDQILSFDGSKFGDNKGKINISQESINLYKIKIEYLWKTNRVPIKIVTLHSRY